MEKTLQAEVTIQLFATELDASETRNKIVRAAKAGLFAAMENPAFGAWEYRIKEWIPED